MEVHRRLVPLQSVRPKHRCSTETSSQRQAAIKRELLAEHARDEGLGVAALAVAAARQIDLRRADLGGGHVEAGATTVEALRFAQGDGCRYAIGRAIGRVLALLMAADDTRAGQTGNGVGCVFGVVYCGASGDARLSA